MFAPSLPNIICQGRREEEGYCQIHHLSRQIFKYTCKIKQDWLKGMGNDGGSKSELTGNWGGGMGLNLECYHSQGVSKKGRHDEGQPCWMEHVDVWPY